MTTRVTYKTIGGQSIDVLSPDPTASGADLLQDNAKAIAEICNTLATSIAAAQSLLTTLQTQVGTKADTSALAAHTSNTSNPHNTTAAQVGLGNVNNTSDAAKPISTATQTALNSKANTSALASYLPLSGGTITGDLSLNVNQSVRFADGNSQYASIYFAEGTGLQFGGGDYPMAMDSSLSLGNNSLNCGAFQSGDITCGDITCGAIDLGGGNIYDISYNGDSWTGDGLQLTNKIIFPDNAYYDNSGFHGVGSTFDLGGGFIYDGSGQLTLSMDNDQYGGVSLILQNRDGCNGAQFYNPGLPLVDFEFVTSNGTDEAGDIRFEQRDDIYGVNNPANALSNGGHGEFILEMGGVQASAIGAYGITNFAPVTFVPQSSAPSSPTKGTMYVDNSGVLHIYNGTAWKQFTVS